ncbi:MAG: winged helix-turn-helix domain-containing protein [Polyangiaceae bacterium]|nr:winged helix-turn-helix domain-containing protein [Polyangiaceae bacterium]
MRPQAPPNPPEIFEGRERELEWLGARLQSCPLSIVWSPPGLGKTGLVLSALARVRCERAIVCSAEGFADEGAFVAEVGRLIAAEAKQETTASPARPSELVAGIVSALDLISVPVVLEDLHLITEPVAEALLIGVARYVRSARLVVTTRRRPRHDDLVERTLPLEPLEDATIERIVWRVRPGIDAARLRAIVSSAAGSPRLARQHSLGLDVQRSIVDGLSPEQRALVMALAEIETPIGLPASDARDVTLNALLAFGYVERGTTGIRVVPNLRSLVRAAAQSSEPSKRTALELASLDARPAACFEVVRLSIELGDLDLTMRTLDARGEELLALGYGEALFGVLGREPTPGTCPPALVSWRFAIADRIRRGPSLVWAAAQPEPVTACDRLIWCALTGYSGDVATAEKRVVAFLSDEAMRALHPEAAVLHADIVSWGGAPARAATLLEGIDVAEPRLRASRDLRLASALSRIGDGDKAAIVLARATETFRGLAPGDRTELRRILISTLLAASRFVELERLVGTAGPAIGASTPEVLSHLVMATERGHVALARRLLEHLRVFAGESLSIRFIVLYNDLRLRTFLGPFETLDRDARAALADERMAAIPDLVVYLFSAHCNVALLFGEPANVMPIPLPEVTEGTNAAMARAFNAIVTLRRGERVVLGAESSSSVEVTLALLRAEIELAIFDGTLDATVRPLDRALALTREQGLALDELSLLAVRLEIHLLRGAGGQGTEAASYELARRASELGSRRFELEAALGQWAISKERSASELLAMAESHESPIASRRARALLGKPAKLDAVDERVVAVVSTWHEHPEALALDLVHKRAMLPSGKVVDLRASPLYLRILETLFRAGGRATKEDLVQRVWEVRSYHPQRDDKRLQVAIHRLRRVLEQDPERPTLLVRDDDCYAVSTPIVLRTLA